VIGGLIVATFVTLFVVPPSTPCCARAASAMSSTRSSTLKAVRFRMSEPIEVRTTLMPPR